MNEDELTQEDIDAYNQRRQKEYDEYTKGNEELRKRAEEQKRIDEILKERPGETSIQRRKRLSRELGKNYKDKETRPDAEIQTEGNLKGQPKPEDIFGENYKGKPTYLDDPQDDEEGNFLDPNSGFRTTLAVGTEVFGNTILDLFSFDPTQLTQFFGAQGVNAIAQRIRGGKFSRGEMIASGIASLLPGGAQTRSLMGSIARTGIRGGVSGAIETGAADLIDTGEIDPERVATGFGIGTAFGGLFGVAAGQKETKQFFSRLRARMGSNLDPEQAVFTPEELRAMGIGEAMAFAKPKNEGLDPKDIKKATDISQDEFNKSLEPTSNLEAGTDLANIKKDIDASNEFNQKQYDIAKKFVFEFDEGQPFKVSKSEINKMKVNARKKLKFKEVKKVQAKLNDPNITDEVVQNYYDDAVRSELGYTGTAGTIDFLNDMMDAPSRKAFTSVDDFIANSRVGQSSIEDILDDMSFKLETPISKEKLQNLLDGTETYSFQTTRMRKKGEAPIVINDINSLQKAYFARLLALDDIAEFEKGHINAVDQIIERFLKGEKITPKASFKDNTNPEIARSIYKLVGNEEAFDAMVDINKDYIVKGLGDRDLKFAQVFAGNRSRKANQDLDRVVNSIFGTEPDLESSLLAYVYPERSLNNLIAPDMKVTFAKTFMKEFDEQVQAILDLGGKMENIGPQRLEVMRQRALKTTLRSFPPDLSKDMGKAIMDYLKANKIDVVDEFGEPRF